MDASNILHMPKLKKDLLKCFRYFKHGSYSMILKTSSNGMTFSDNEDFGIFFNKHWRWCVELLALRLWMCFVFVQKYKHMTNMFMALKNSGFAANIEHLVNIYRGINNYLPMSQHYC